MSSSRIRFRTLLTLLTLVFVINTAWAQDKGGFRISESTRLGGYMDHELRFDFDEDLKQTLSTFRAHRFVPMITSDITDRLRVQSEIEFEYGGNVQKAGEIKIEYASMDFRLADWLVFRGGILLSPVGRFNLYHDSPLNDLTDRPMVAQQIIPTTLSEAGMGFHGTLGLTENQALTYELYAVNGFNDDLLVLDELGVPQRVRIRSGRGNQKTDFNNNKALTGRLSWSPLLGTGIGASVHSGAYDATGEDRLTILALDAIVARGPIEVQGEFARASTELGQYGLDTQIQNGAYGQLSFHIPTDAVLYGSLFTLVGRYDYLDFGVAGDLEDVRQDRITVGLNFRPTEQTVFKLDWGFNRQAAPEGDYKDTGSTAFFSFATYF